MLALGGLALALWFFTSNDDATTGTPIGTVPGVAAAQDPRAFASELAHGNLVLSVDDRARFAAAQRLTREVTGGEDSPALRAAGQSIRIVAPEGPQASAVIAYAHGRTIAAPSLDDPGLRAFLDYWLGRAAG